MDDEQDSTTVAIYVEDSNRSDHVVAGASAGGTTPMDATHKTGLAETVVEVDEGDQEVDSDDEKEALLDFEVDNVPERRRRSVLDVLPVWLRSRDSRGYAAIPLDTPHPSPVATSKLYILFVLPVLLLVPGLWYLKFPPASPPPPPPVYSGCSSGEYLAAIKDAQPVKGDIPSSHLIDPQYYPSNALPPLNFSFEFTSTSCPRPHVFTPAEACELLGDYGGIVAFGDSFLRHMWSAMLILLRGDLSGSTEDFLGDKQLCNGEKIFDDRGAVCRFRVTEDWQTSMQPVCNGTLEGVKFEVAVFSHLAPTLARFTKFYNNTKPPIVLQAFGPHFDYKIEYTRPWHVWMKEYLAENNNPPIVSVWAAPHSPNELQPEWYRATQGPAIVEKFAHELEATVANDAPYAKVISYYNVSTP
ncbi:hypothetical protein MNV49_004655 [Pseudohyphozyma bogoriensis]|nr:hypothetical protein MNV49_004655 [Pseudohyphozyma bogoriensis]